MYFFLLRKLIYFNLLLFNNYLSDWILIINVFSTIVENDIILL